MVRNLVGPKINYSAVRLIDLNAIRTFASVVHEHLGGADLDVESVDVVHGEVVCQPGTRGIPIQRTYSDPLAVSGQVSAGKLARATVPNEAASRAVS